MKTSQYTPHSIPIPNMTNVKTNYSSFDGIDNIEKTLEEVKELIEKSKALSLGEIISPSNHSSELNDKILNSPKSESESELELESKSEPESETNSINKDQTNNKVVTVIKNQSSSNKEVKKKNFFFFNFISIHN